MIENNSNGQIKNIVKLLKNSRERRRQNCYITEGPKMVIEAIKSSVVLKIYISNQLWKSVGNNEERLIDNNRLAGFKPQEFIELIKNCEYEVVKDSVFNELSDTVSPQGIIAVTKMKDMNIDQIMKSGSGITHFCNETACMNIRRYIILEDLQDPGNLGTIFRTAEAAGYNGIIMNKGTVDAYNPKVVRSTMGAVFRVPFVQCDDIKQIINTCRENRIMVYGAALNGEDIREVKYPASMAFVIGNESKGISERTIELCDYLVRIPMCGSTESLNAAVASGIIMYMSNLPFM